MTNVVVHLSGATARYSQIAHGTRRVLDKLPEAVLKDIGLARSDIPFIGGKLADKCKDPDLKAFAANTLPTLQKHLDAIEAIKKKM